MKQENDILNGIGDLISRLYEHADSIADTGVSKHDSCSLSAEAATTIDILAERIIDSENTSGLRAYELGQKLLTKQAYIDYLKSRLDEFDIGYQPE